MRPYRRGYGFIAMLLFSLALSACGVDASRDPLATDDPARGRQAIDYYACGACHHIPGISGARGTVGPPLADLARRVYLAGLLPNTPDNLVSWIRKPQTFAPGTAMPDMQVSEVDARAIAAYLYRRQ